MVLVNAMVLVNVMMLTHVMMLPRVMVSTPDDYGGHQHETEEVSARRA